MLHDILRGTVLNTEFTSGSDPGIMIRHGRSIDSTLAKLKEFKSYRSSYPYGFINIKPEGLFNRR